jgi:hypothetical protein
MSSSPRAGRPAAVGELVVRVSQARAAVPGRLRITYSAQIDGPDAQAQQIGPVITADFPDTIASLIALARERTQ